VVNAFAVPGGYVYFTRGILATLNSEAELAGVMGHEIGHITARHSAQQYSRAQFAQIGLLGLGLALPGAFSPLAEAAGLGVGMLFLSFSRNDERQADDLGVEYASKLGYDAAQMSNFFETLERMKPQSDRSGLPDWFSTHPNPENRIKAIRARAKEWQDRLGRRDSLLHRDDTSRIDGLVFESARYVQEHIPPRTPFHFHSAIEINNTPGIQMVSGEGSSDSLHHDKTSLNGALTFATNNKARVISN
jgi:predicted Zn-dependent protease